MYIYIYINNFFIYNFGYIRRRAFIKRLKNGIFASTIIILNAKHAAVVVVVVAKESVIFVIRDFIENSVNRKHI